MSKSITAYQGKEFTVTLESTVASTNYGWCLMSMPAEVVLASICFEPTATGKFGGSAKQIFTFFALGYDTEIKPIVFQEICFHNTCETGRKISVAVNVIPYNECDAAGEGLDGFVEYSENSATFSSVSNIHVAYGSPYTCGSSDVIIDKYGIPCVESALETLKGEDLCIVKYGIVCNNNNDTMLVKYGSPCIVKYGIACTKK